MKKIILNKQLILESISEQEKHKVLLQNFLNKEDPKNIAIEQQKLAGVNAGVIDSETKQNLININHKNKLINNNDLDRDGSGTISGKELKQHLYASKSF